MIDLTAALEALYAGFPLDAIALGWAGHGLDMKCLRRVSNSLLGTRVDHDTGIFLVQHRLYRPRSGTPRALPSPTIGRWMWGLPPDEVRGRLSAPGSIVTEWDHFVVLPVRTCAERLEPWVTRKGTRLDHVASRGKEVIHTR